MSLGRTIVVELVDALRADPALASELRALLTVPHVQPAPVAMPFCRIPAYAQRVALSERTIWSLVAKGLPVVGAGRSRRVDVARADKWLAERREHVDDGIERSARASARRAAHAATK